MKTKIFMKVAGWHTLLCIAGLSLLLSGCETPMSEQELSSPTVFTATIDADEPATRTLLGNAASPTDPRDVLWKEDDELIVGGATYKLSSGANTTTGTLTPKVASQLAQKDPVTGKYEAYYPTLIYNGGTPTLRDTQTYEAPETVGSEKFVVASHFPMYAQSETTELSFKNLCAVLNFKLTGTDKVTKVVVTSATQNLSGPFDVVETTSGAGDWYAKIKDSDPAASNQVTLDCSGVPGGGVQLDAAVATEFCIAVPAADYAKDDLTVQVFGPGDTEIMPSFKNSVSISQLKRSEIYDITKEAKAKIFSVTYGGTTTSSTGTPVTAVTFNGGADTNPKTHSFTVTSDMGYKVTISAPTAAYTDKQSDPTAGGVVTMTVNRYSDKYRIGGISEFRRDALFSVSATQQVYFSPGNLQYRAKRADGVTTYESTNTFRFAERQYDVVGCSRVSLDGNVFTDDLSGFCDNISISSDYTGWIDLFGWGTSGKDYGARRFMPYEYLPPASDYGPLSGDLTGDSDWGAADIWDGATLIPGGTYRTLTLAEWTYLVSQRNVLAPGWCSSQVAFFSGSETFTFQITFEAYDDPSYSVTYNVTARKQEDWRGLLIFPDNFADTDLISRAGLTYAGSTYLHFLLGSRKFLDVNLWPEFERAGCVFLPALPGSIRYYYPTSGQHSPVDGDDVKYWTASSRDQTYGWCFRAGADNIYSPCDKYGGLAVRLVKDVTP